jgi:hypothetical protein
MIDGQRVKLQVAHAKLCYSRAFVLRAYLLQTQEMLFGAHNHAFVLCTLWRASLLREFQG